MNGSTWDRMAPVPAWEITGDMDGFAVRFHGEKVATAPGFDAARAIYNSLRAHSAMAMESLRHTLATSPYRRAA